jgi:hypothetical protein
MGSSHPVRQFIVKCLRKGIRIVNLFLFDDTKQKRRHSSTVNCQPFGPLGPPTPTRPV